MNYEHIHRHCNREDNDRIHDELKDRSWKELRDFQKTFPPPRDDVDYNWMIEILSEELWIDGDYFALYLYWNDPYTDFWKRWNRWKNLRVFL